MTLLYLDRLFWKHVAVALGAVAVSAAVGAIVNNKIFNQFVTNKEPEESKEK